MILALDAEDVVARQAKTARLQVLLQACLGILERLELRQCIDPGGEQPCDDPLGGSEPPIEIDRPEEGLERVGED